MRLIVTETETLEIQKVLLDLLSQYNRTIQDPDQDINKMVVKASNRVADIFEDK